MKTVESEFHFLLICPLYKELRSKYIKKYYRTWPNLNKFRDLMKNNSTTIMKNLAAFIYHANIKRTNAL